jgi:thioredoxin-dependent peroxiredoxin
VSALHLEKAPKSSSTTIGCKAPDFLLRTDGGEDWRLSEKTGSVTVLLFYPQNETLVCTKQLCSVRDNWHQYLETKATIVGISPGTPDGHREFSERLNLPITLLADPERKVTKIYGKHWLYPISFTRAVVVIDSHGIVRNRDIMLRAFRPSDAHLITDIYAARGDELHETYDAMRNRIASVINK